MGGSEPGFIEHVIVALCQATALIFFYLLFYLHMSKVIRVSKQVIDKYLFACPGHV